MKEHPQLFNGDMVRAILDDHKTNTRRVITPRNSFLDGRPWDKVYKAATPDWDNAYIDPGPSPAGNPGPYLKLPFPEFDTTHRIYPRVQVGDHLWVREGFRYADKLVDGYERDDPYYVQYRADGLVYKIHDERPVITDRDWAKGWSQNRKFGAYKPSIYMPRWASRITLEVTGVRPERVQDISEDDAIAEGILSLSWLDEALENLNKLGVKKKMQPSWIFQELWDSIHKKPTTVWEANPWVFVIEFSVLSL